jgi:ankyrin repeat protein
MIANSRIGRVLLHALCAITPPLHHSIPHKIPRNLSRSFPLYGVEAGGLPLREAGINLKHALPQKELNMKTRSLKFVFNRAWPVVLAAELFAGCQSCPLQQSIRRGDQSAALKMIQNGKGLDKPDNLGNTALLCAAQRGNLAVARALIEKGADLNHRNNAGAFPLSIAAARGNAEMVRLLLTKGADVNQATPKFHLTALVFASRAGNRGIVADLLNARASAETAPMALVEAASRGHLPVVELLLARGTQLNLQANHLNAALLAGARCGSLAVVNLLLAHHASANCRGSGGQTPLIAAAASGHTSVCAALLRVGAPIEWKDQAGDTALSAAIRAFQLAAAGLLVNAGATFAGSTNTLNERFCLAIYQKLLADKQVAETETAEARRNYTTALAALTAAQAEFAKLAKHDNRKASSKAFWGAVLQGVAAGMAEGAASSAAGYHSYSSYKNTAQLVALRNAKTPGQYSANVGALMKQYHLAPVAYGTIVPVSRASGESPAIQRLRAEARNLNAKAELCQQLIADIQQALARGRELANHPNPGRGQRVTPQTTAQNASSPAPLASIPQ